MYYYFQFTYSFRQRVEMILNNNEYLSIDTDTVKDKTLN